MGALALVVLTVVEVCVVVAVVHVALRHPMQARGIVPWRVADTVLTAPLAFAGLAAFFGAANRLLVGIVTRGEWPAAWLGVAAAGLVAAAFGIRAIGKLY